ncbi:MAG: pyrroloquinoline quinone-dependent dehydrogenase [Burkholderiales bacterium]
MRRPAALGAVALAALVFGGAPANPSLGAQTSGTPPGAVDDTRLLAASGEPNNWITFGHNYTNQRFSGLRRIDRSNVRRLVPRWVYQTGVAGEFQATPLVVDGVMYLTTSDNHAVALDARTGDRIWRYDHRPRTDLKFGSSSNRGAAVAYGMVYEATNDGRLIALDQKTGKVVWDQVVAQPEEGETEALAMFGDAFKESSVTGSTRLGYKMPPLVYKGKVIVGNAGAGYGLHIETKGEIGVLGVEGDGFGRRGYVSAHDAHTGKELWRWYSTKANGWEGEYRETTPDGLPLHRDIAGEKAAAPRYRDAWRIGGGSLWMTPALDPEMGLIFLGTGNPSPQNYGLSRPGDNLYTMCLVALDVDTGQLRWYYQQVPHDVWGYDVASQPFLFDIVRNGQTVKAVGQASKTGWFYVHDRRTGALLYKSEPFVPIRNIFAQPTREGIIVAPGALGGASWSPVSYNPATGIAYVAALHTPARYSLGTTAADAGSPKGRGYALLEITASGQPTWGTLTAVDVRGGGRIKWQVKTPETLTGGVLATASGLVFMGEGSGYFNAYDAETGERLWRFQTGAGVGAPPMAYEVDGVQYVAVASGGGFNRRTYPPGDALFVFALPE